MFRLRRRARELHPEVGTRDGRIIDDPGYPPTAHLEIVYAEVKDRLDIQRTELDDLQRIVAIVLATSGVVLGFAGSRFPTYRTDHLAFWLFVAAIVLLAIDTAVGVAALWPRSVRATAEPGTLADEYVGAATNVLLFDLIRAAREAFDINEAVGIRRHRSRLVRSQLLLLAAGATVLGAGVMVAHL